MMKSSPQCHCYVVNNTSKNFLSREGRQTAGSIRVGWQGVISGDSIIDQMFAFFVLRLRYTSCLPIAIPPSYAFLPGPYGMLED